MITYLQFIEELDLIQMEFDQAKDPAFAKIMVEGRVKNLKAKYQGYVAEHEQQENA